MKSAEKPTKLTLESMKTRAAREAEKQVEKLVRAKEDPASPPPVAGSPPEAQRQIDQILRVSPAVIYRCGPGPDYPVVYISQNCANLLGFAAEAFLSQPHFWGDQVHPDDQERVEELVVNIEKGRPVALEYRFQKADGQWVWLHDTITPSFDQQRKVCGFIGSCMDITNSKLTEEELRKSEARFRELFEKAPDMCVVLDKDGYVIDLNDRCAARLEQSRATLEGSLLADIVHLEDVERFSRLLVETRREERVEQTEEIRLMTGKGAALWVNVEFCAFDAGDGQAKTVLLVCRDISKRKKMQRDLARAQRLETAGQIAGQIAHDFNNLLAPLTAYPILIREEVSDNPKLVSLLDEMESASRQIAEINQQLLALGRRGHYRMEPIDLNELVEETVPLQPIPAGMTVKQELSRDDCLITGGAAQLTRVLINLMNNAVEATQGAGTLTIKTEPVSAADESVHGNHADMRPFIRLSFADDGPGISPDNIEKIFDPFFTTKKMDRVRGSGLGLSAVHGIVEDHGGFVKVESTVGSGTVFSLYFPALFETAVAAPAGQTSVRGGSERILVVDDDRTQCNVTSQLLAKLGYAVETVRSGEEAIHFCQKYDIDLLILDMMMEGIDGTETFRRVLEFKPEQKAIIVSGYVTTNRVEEALRMGVGQFVSKPVTFKTLANAVRKELDGTRDKPRSNL